METCKYCGIDLNDILLPECDCIERINCYKAGTIGHIFCGKLSCGCPKFTGCLGGHKEE